MDTKRILEKRDSRKTHFEVEVPIQVLNPTSPEPKALTPGFCFLDVPLPPPNRSDDVVSSQESSLIEVSTPQTGQRHTFMSEETRRLLRKVQYIKATAKWNLDNDASSDSTETTKTEEAKHQTMTTLDDVSTQLTLTRSSKTESSSCSKNNLREERKRANSSLALKEVAVQTEPKRVRYQPPTPVMRSRSDDSFRVRSRSVEPEPRRRSPPPPLSRMLRSKSMGEETREQRNERRRLLRAKRLNEKPWRLNMKKSGERRHQEDEIKLGSTMTHDLDEKDDSEKENKKESDIEAKAKKPWRANMKKPPSQTQKSSVTTSLVEKKAREKAETEALARYIKAKQSKTKEVEKMKQEAKEREKEDIKNRLMALELERRKAYKLSLLNKTQNILKNQSKLDHDKVMAKETLDHKKAKEHQILKRRLQQLVTEVRHLQDKPEGKETNNEAEDDKHPPISRASVIQGSGGFRVNSMSLPPFASANHQTEAADQIMGEQKATASEPDGPNWGPTHLIDHETGPVIPAPREEQTETRKVLNELARRHQKDLELVRKLSGNSRNDLELKRPVSSPIPVLGGRGPKNDSSITLITTDEEESRPPQLYFADSPEPPPTADPLNFLSTIRRKMPNFKADQQVSEGTISEGPLSPSSSNSTPTPRSLQPASDVKSKHTSLEKSQASEAKLKVDVDVEAIGQSRHPALERSDALRLRFLSELNQLEGLEEAERQMRQLDHLRQITKVNTEAASMAEYIRSVKERQTKRTKDPKRAFEQRVRREFESLLSDKIQHLMKQQVEASKVTAEAAKQLVSLNLIKTRETGGDLDSKANSVKDASRVDKSVKSLLTRTDSNIPEVLSAIDRTESSSKAIPKTISELLHKLEHKTDVSEAEVTEDIVNDMDMSGSSKLDAESTIRDSISSLSSTNGKDKRSHSIQSLFSENDSFAKLSMQMFQQHLEEESVRARHQYKLLKIKEKQLVDKVKKEIASLERSKKTAKESNDIGKVTSMKKRERALLLELKSRRAEIEHLKQGIKVAEKERQLILQQQKKMMKKERKSRSASIEYHPSESLENSVSTAMESSQETSRRQEDTTNHSSPSASIVEEIKPEASPDRRSVASPSKIESLKKLMGTTLKTPLSPKLHRRRHSSADSNDSFTVSQTEAASDHSDYEIRLSTLKDELQRRMVTAAKLKRQQRLRNREKFQMQEDALKKQIEKYDKLIEETQHELERSVPLVQPQIKIPKQSLSPGPSTPTALRRSSTESLPSYQHHLQQQTSIDEITEDNSLVSVSADSSLSTVVASPKVQEESMPPKFQAETSVNSQKSEENSDLNYSDDFTSSNATSSDFSDPTAETAKAEVAAPLETLVSVDKVKTPNKDLAEAITSSILDSLIKDVCKRYTELSRAPEKPKMKHEILQTAFDISSGSSDEFDEAINEGKQVDDPHTTEGFIDDDYGLSSIRQESEQIRQQQLIIEQEIKRIQQETLGRNIPNKPPPPYTPPTSSSSTPSPRLETKAARPRPPPKYVPSEREELLALARSITTSLYQSRLSGKPIEVEVNHLVDMCSDKDDTNGEKMESKRMFVTFVRDFVIELTTDIYKCETESQNPPWMAQKPLDVEKFKLPKSEAELVARVERELLVFFGFEKRAQKENLIVRWSLKRDRVDQILVRELHAEEAAWTDYSDDAVKVKDSVAKAITDLLLKDTTAEMCRLLIG